MDSATAGKVLPTRSPWPLPRGRYVTLGSGDVTFIRDTGGHPTSRCCSSFMGGPPRPT